MPQLVSRLSRLGTRRSMLGGGRIWLVITMVAWLIRGVRWLATRGDVSIREELRPGETLLIEHIDEPLGSRPR